jgi:hypothetical protein
MPGPGHNGSAARREETPVIERHHYLKLKSEFANAASREEIVRRVLEVLPDVPGVRGVSAGTPADADAERSWDVFITVRFETVGDVADYRAHPDHRRFVDEFLSPRVEVKKAWNFHARTAGA